MPENRRRRCPWCAEQIQEQAVICRYCQRDVPPLREAARPPSRPAPGEVELGDPGAPSGGASPAASPILPIAQRGPVVVYPETAVLTAEQVAEALQIGVDMVVELKLPHARLGHRTVRYHWGQVLAFLRKMAT